MYKYVYKGPDIASVQVVSRQGDPVNNNTDTNPKNMKKLKKL